MRQISEENQAEEGAEVVFIPFLKMVQVQPHICGVWSCKGPWGAEQCSSSASPVAW